MTSHFDPNPDDRLRSCRKLRWDVPLEQEDMGIFQQIAPHAVHHCCTEEQLLSGHSQSSGWAWILDDDVFDKIPYPSRRLIACLVAIGLESRCNPLPCPAALAITVDGISLPDLLRDTFEVRDPQEPDDYKGLTHAILDSCSGFDFLLAEIDHKPGFDCVASRLCQPHRLDNTPTTAKDLRLDNWTYNGPLQIIRVDRDLMDLALHWARWIRVREEWNESITCFLSMERRYTARPEHYWSRDTTTYPVQAQADNLLWRAYARLAFEGIGAQLRPLTNEAHSLCERTRLACPHWRNPTGRNSPYFTPCTNVIKALDPEGLHGARIIWPLEWATKIDADECLSRHIPKPKVLWIPQDGELKAYKFLEWVCDGAFQYDWEPSSLPKPGAAISVARWKQLSPILQVKALQILGQHLSGDPNLEYPTIHSRYLLLDSRPSHPDPRAQSGPLHFVVHTHPTTKHQLPLIVTPAHHPTLYNDNAAAYYRLPKPEFPAHAEQATREDSYMGLNTTTNDHNYGDTRILEIEDIDLKMVD